MFYLIIKSYKKHFLRNNNSKLVIILLDYEYNNNFFKNLNLLDSKKNSYKMWNFNSTRNS